MPAPFPHNYVAQVTRTGPARAQLDAASRPSLVGGPPPEFGGDEASWSPEHLLLSSLGLCLFTTFEAIASRAHLHVSSWRATVGAVLDRTPAGLAFSRFTVDVDVAVPALEVEQATAILERARSQCLVSNALRVPVFVNARVMTASDVAA